MTKQTKKVVNRKVQNKSELLFNEKKDLTILFKFLAFTLAIIGLVTVFNWVYSNWNYIEPAAWMSSICLIFRKQIIDVLFSK